VLLLCDKLSGQLDLLIELPEPPLVICLDQSQRLLLGQQTHLLLDCEKLGIRSNRVVVGSFTGIGLRGRIDRRGGFPTTEIAPSSTTL
jgi:hypothetical protein